MKATPIFGLFLLLLMGLGINSGTVRVQAGGGDLDIDLSPVWTTGVISDRFGESGIVVEDINHDGFDEVIACSENAFALRYDLVGEYEPIWYSQDINCLRIATGDRDRNGDVEIYAAALDEIVLFDSNNFSELDRFPFSGTFPTDIVTDDVDDDGNLEIIVSSYESTYIYDANNYSLEWEATGFGGASLDTGEIDGDSDIEIVVNEPNVQASILNARTKTLEWAYSGGMGVRISLGDVDNDQIDEIAFIANWENLEVFDADSLTTKWSLGGLGDLNEVLVADMDDDGFAEVLVGNGQWGNVTGYDGDSGAFLWAIHNPEHGVFGLAAGDPDGDGSTEVVFGAGLSSSGKDAMFVGDWMTETIEYSSRDLDGSLRTAAADIDLDGTVEIVVASFSTTSGYDGGTVLVYDGETHELEWTALVAASFYDIYELHIGQLDGDAALEILVGGENWYDTRFTVFDGITQANEWESAELGSGKPVEILVENIDADAVDEILLAVPGIDGRVLVFNGASAIVQWDSGTLGFIQDISLADVDGDNIAELGVLLNTDLIVFDSTNWTQENSYGVTDGRRLGILSHGPGKPGSFIVLALSDGVYKVRVLHAATGGTMLSLPLPGLDWVDLMIEDFDLDGTEEIAVFGLSTSTGASFLEIYSSPFPLVLWSEYTETGFWGAINSLALGDVDNDSSQELVLGSSKLVQVREMTKMPLNLNLEFLPSVQH